MKRLFLFVLVFLAILPSMALETNALSNYNFEPDMNFYKTFFCSSDELNYPVNQDNIVCTIEKIVNKLFFYKTLSQEVAPNGMTARDMLACVIYQEAGWDKSCDECRRRVGDVVLNRIQHEYFPNTIYEVLTQKGQYGKFYWTGIKWSEHSYNDERGVARAYAIADELLSGKHSDIYGKDYIWQAEFKQGKSGFWCCDTYFGKS